MHDSSELDSLIDRALASYGDPAADPQLAERVLARVRHPMPATHRPAPRRWLPWTAALAAAACALALIFATLWPKHVPINPQPNSLRGDSTTAQVPSLPHARPMPFHRAHRPIASARHAEQPHQETARALPLPKLDVFPTPEPMSDEEQAFAFFIQRAPPSEISALRQAQATADLPVTIEELKIQPLKPLDEGGR